MRLLIATNNAHKLAEFRGIFSTHDVSAPRDLGIDFDAEETGATFLENALIKARALAAEPAAAGMAVIADDSGICVDALGGAPGVYSARYGGSAERPELTAEERNALLLARLRGATTRNAHFVCCMVAIVGTDRLVVAQESWYGSIALEPSKARGGFGYDPVFVADGLGVTAADLDAEAKNRISHRGRASRVLSAALNEMQALAAR